MELWQEKAFDLRQYKKTTLRRRRKSENCRSAPRSSPVRGIRDESAVGERLTSSPGLCPPKVGQDSETSYQEITHRTVGGEFDRDTRLPLPNPGADFQYAKSDGLHACASQGGVLEQVRLETVEEHVGRGMEEDPELIGLKFGTGGTVGFEEKFVLFDVEFIFSTWAIAVSREDGGSESLNVGDDKAQVQSFLREFDFGDDASLDAPRIGSIGK